MNPTRQQLNDDLYYFLTCKSKQSAIVGSQYRVLHDREYRWFRVWRRTDQGWSFVGMQQGRNPIETVVEIINE